MDKAFSWANGIALQHRFSLVKSTYKVNNSSKLRYLYARCNRGGNYKGEVKDPEKALRANTSTLKCKCPFNVKIQELRCGSVMIKPRDDIHNHELTVYTDGHRRRAAMDDEQKAYVLEQAVAQVRPAHIRRGLYVQNPDKPQPTIRQIYNFISKLSSQERGGRNHAQQMFQRAVKHNYLWFMEKNPETDQLTDIFMAHPEGVQLFRTYFYVICIDSTYKTNKYGMPLVEFIGVTPSGKNFSIGYAIVTSEDENGYRWCLEKIRSLLPENVSPSVVVTDRELALTNMIAEVFPNAAHFLCTWHIACAVEARSTKVFGKGVACNRFNIRWKKIMYASTEEELFRRVESAHAALKKWLVSSTLALDTLWTRAHAFLEGQHVEIRKELEYNRSKHLHQNYGDLFTLLKGRVAIKAVILMINEFKRGETLGVGLTDRCGCVLVRTHGLLCACRLHDMYQNKHKVHVEDVHEFWRTLVYSNPSDNPCSNVDRLNDLLDEVRGSDPTMQRGIMDYIYRQLHPEDEDIEEPAVRESRRGRPRNGRNLSAVEHARRSSGRSSRGTSTPASTPHASTSISFNTDGSAPLEKNYVIFHVNFGWTHTIPTATSEFLTAFYDPKADGHCGFRCISHALRGDEEGYISVRGALLRELTSDPRYIDIFGDVEYRQIPTRVGFLRPVHCGPEYWMDGRDLYGFATIHNWAICLITSNIFNGVRLFIVCSTYLPLRALPDVTQPFGVMVIMLFANHFIRLHLEGNFPMPPVHVSWERTRDASVANWDNLYRQRIQTWRNFLNNI
ncbi:hypothetical protein RND81_11G157200 [Saponaria officinalis]|uniref:MULE transposase domain-containing protein n=1 Tax=Saponaria officinalis TaxID=3572 RepID=A0AAW1HLM1_SAPOF